MILITGAAGFIGSKVAQKFNEIGFKTITIDNLSTGSVKNIPKSTIFIEGSCGEQEVIDKLDQYPIEGIIHIAGQSSGEVSFEDPAYDLESNTLSTILLLRYARLKGIKRFVFASTMSLYGDMSTLPVSEEAETLPKSFYACGKLASEHYLRIFSEYNLETIALRLFNVYGPGQNMKNLKQGMLSIFLAQALNSSKIIVKGSGERFRDFVYIDDVVEAFRIAYFATYKSYNAYNVCSSKPIKVTQLIRKILAELKLDLPVEYFENTPGDQFGIYGSYTKIKTELGWSPQVEFDPGLKKMIQWCKNDLDD